MKIEFAPRFIRDLKKIENDNILSKVKLIILECEKTTALYKVGNLIKIRGFKSFYRIKVGKYRIGISFKKDTIIFVRVLHRKEIYRYFP